MVRLLRRFWRLCSKLDSAMTALQMPNRPSSKQTLTSRCHHYGPYFVLKYDQWFVLTIVIVFYLKKSKFDINFRLFLQQPPACSSKNLQTTALLQISEEEEDTESSWETLCVKSIFIRTSTLTKRALRLCHSCSNKGLKSPRGVPYLPNCQRTRSSFCWSSRQRRCIGNGKTFSSSITIQNVWLLCCQQVS